MEEYIEPSQIELASSEQYSAVTIFILLTLLILYLYVAIKEYPKWRKLRENFFTKSKKESKVHSANSAEPKSPLLYIPFIPFAVIYLTMRIIWDMFRLFVFYSLNLIEAGSLMFCRLLIRNIKMIPKICAVIPSLWKTYIQNPFNKILNMWLDWMYLYGWPLFKSTVITLWDVGVITWTEGKEAIIYLWDFLVKYSKIGWNEIAIPSLEFMSWAVITFILEPGNWILSKTIYLGKIGWYCACFLARDLAEDLKELFCVGWKISVIIYNNALQPTGKLIRYLIIGLHERIKYYFPILKKFLHTEFIIATNEAIYIIYEIFRDPLFRSCAECIYSIIRSAVLYNIIKNILCNISRKLQIIKPKFINCMRQRGLELVEFSFISVLEIMRSAYDYYTILLPIIINIPIIYNEVKRICNEFYRHVMENVVTILKSLWTVFAPLLRPIILALSFFYTTVILVILLSAFRIVNCIASKSIIALSEVLVSLCKDLSKLYFILESTYNNFISPYASSILQTSKKVMNELYIIINNFMAEYFPTFVNYFTGVVLRQVQIFKDHIMNAYEKYEPDIMEFKNHIKVAADEAVVGIGQSMLEWVKKERELKGGISFKEK